MIVLQDFTNDDFDQLIQWIPNQELLHKWCGSLFSYPLKHSSLNWYIKESNQPGTSDAFIYKAVNMVNNQTIGHISLGGISWKNKSARITRVLVGDEYQGKGFCCAMTKAVIDVGFETLDLHRISLGVYSSNDAALKCYKKAGMMQEGVHRDVFLYKGQYWSMIEMSILQTEWKAQKQQAQANELNK